MPSIFNIVRADATQEDHLYVSPVEDEESMYVAVVLFKGRFSPFFVSRISAEDVKKKADVWISTNLSATTTYRGEM